MDCYLISEDIYKIIKNDNKIEISKKNNENSKENNNEILILNGFIKIGRAHV